MAKMTKKEIEKQMDVNHGRFLNEKKVKNKLAEMEMMRNEMKPMPEMRMMPTPNQKRKNSGYI